MAAIAAEITEAEVLHLRWDQLHSEVLLVYVCYAYSSKNLNTCLQKQGIWNVSTSEQHTV